MKWGPLLFVFLAVVFFSICIPAGIAGLWLWRNRETDEGISPVVTRAALVLFAISYESLCRLISAAFGFQGPKPIYSTGFAIIYWQGQAVMAAAIIDFLLLMVKGKHRSKNERERKD